MNHFLVIGGSGFIGSHIVRYLSANCTAHVTVADLAPPPYPRTSAIHYIKCDVRNPLTLDFDHPPTTVVNLAAIHRTPGHANHEYHETNEAGAKHVTELCTSLGVNSLWFTSSIAVYGPSEDVLTEDSLLCPETAYGVSKKTAEDIHKTWAVADSDRKLLIVRPAAVFGPGENGNFSRLARALKAGLFLYPGKKDTIKACGYVNDLVRSLFFMSARSQGVTIYNYCYPQAYTIADITDAFIRVGDYRAFRATMPTAPLLAISALCEFANTIGIRNGINPARVLKLRRSTNIEPRALVESKFQFDTTLETALLQWQTEKSSYEFT